MRCEIIPGTLSVEMYLRQSGHQRDVVEEDQLVEAAGGGVIEVSKEDHVLEENMNGLSSGRL